MKKIISLFILSVLSITAHSQVLTNTTWSVYDTSNVFYIYFHFDGDTLSYSSDNVSYYNVSLYAENGNNFSIFDLIGTCTDTGYYTFSIQSDTLLFTLIADTCASGQRARVLSTYHWVRLLTGISENSEQNIMPLIYPNPAHNILNVESRVLGMQNVELKIYDLTGRIVHEETLHFQLSTFNFQLASGLYLVRIEAGNSVWQEKLVVE